MKIFYQGVRNVGSLNKQRGKENQGWDVNNTLKKGKFKIRKVR